MDSLCKTCQNLNLHIESFIETGWEYPTTMKTIYPKHGHEGEYITKVKALTILDYLRRLKVPVKDPGKNLSLRSGKYYSKKFLDKKFRVPIAYTHENPRPGARSGMDGPIKYQELGPMSQVKKNEKCNLCQFISHEWEALVSSLPLKRMGNIWIVFRFDPYGDRVQNPQNGICLASDTLSTSGGRFRAFICDVEKDWKPNYMLSNAAELMPVENNPSSRQPGGRILDPSFIDANIPKRWLKSCEMHHGSRCNAPLALKTANLPADFSVIDVENFCIVDGFTGCRYVALSYVWGNTTVFQANLSNIQKLKQSGSFLDLMNVLPRTIIDAIAFVRALTERYLWVDSLCIIQDDLPAKKNQQISEMYRIYGGAIATIIATAGEDANSGLPGVAPHDRSRVMKQKICRYSDGLSLLLSPCVNQNQNPYDRIVATRWASRAWTYQERQLSTRKFIFIDGTLYWSCSLLRWSEETISSSETSPPPWAYSDEPIFSRDHIFSPFYQDEAALTPSNLRMLWGKVVQNYSTLSLTLESDVLRAIAGLETCCSSIFNTGFFYGLPTSDIEYFLRWSEEPPGSYRLRRRACGDTLIPSWSWTGWVGRVGWPTFDSADEDSLGYPHIQWKGIDNSNISNSLSNTRTAYLHIFSMCNTCQVSGTWGWPRDVPLAWGSTHDYSIIANSSEWMGSVAMIDPACTDGDFDFVIISKAQRFYPSYFFVPMRDIDRFFFYFVVAVRWKAEVAERIGFGRVRVDAWHKSNPTWRDVTFG